jgi:2-dehydro-3-deoxyphosphogluconate aldolase/(4S)-4-hydroxy-2-oxoglutarate aldolase
MKLVDSGVVSVVRADSPEKALKIVDAVVRGGISSIELTYSVPRANDVIAELVEKYAGTNVLIGAGTVLEAVSARLAIVAGAQFIVSPSFDEEVAKVCNLYQIPYIPGVLTPAEAVHAMQFGSEIIKLFPGDIAGKAMIKDLKGPFPSINVMPSGGVSADNVAEWFQAGAIAVSAGGGVTKPAETGDYVAVSANAKKFVDAARAARK